MTSRSVWNTGPEVRAEVGIFVHEGREYSSGGAFVSPDRLVCYPHADGTVRAWDGEVLGTYRVLSSRPAIFFGHPSWIGSHYYCMRATVAGRAYSLRGFGVGCVAMGRAFERRQFMSKRADVSVSNHGGILLFRPATDRGRTWLNENTEGTWFADALVVEHRYARDLADGMLADGLGVA